MANIVMIIRILLLVNHFIIAITSTCTIIP
jgi:hypothetical protein